MIKKTIVTGANGFIGSSLLKVMSENNIQIYAIIKDTNGNIDQIRDLPGVSIIYCDLDKINQLPKLINDRDIDTCIHLAWAGSFGDARADYELQLTNVKYALNIVDTISKMGIRRFVGAGTLAEKDVLNYHPTDGSTPDAVSIYGIAKIATHFMTKAECSKLGIEHVWCYLSNTYGIGNTTNNFINMATMLMLDGKRASFTAGEQIYDFMYITDTARAIYYAATKGKKNTAYYLGSSQQRKLKEYIKIIRDLIDPSIELHLGEIPFNGISLPNEAFDATKLVEDTGFKPLVSFDEGIKKTIEWLRKERTNKKTKRQTNIIE
jgi:nucleoside-diphosphate-sugar epimerase